MEKSEDLEETQTISPLDLNEENENKKKKPSKKTVIIASTIAAIVVLAGVGGYAYASTSAYSDYESQVESAKTIDAKLVKKIENAQNLTKETKDTDVLDKTLLGSLNASVKSGEAQKGSPKAEAVNKWMLWDVSKAKTTVADDISAATKAISSIDAAMGKVESSKTAKQVKDAKDTLNKAISDAETLYKDSEGKVQDNKTRESLKTAIDNAKKTSGDKKADVKSLTTANNTLSKAVKAVNDSKNAKAQADAQKQAQEQAQVQVQSNGVSSETYSNNGGGSYSGGSSQYTQPQNSNNCTQYGCNGYDYRKDFDSAGGGFAPITKDNINQDGSITIGGDSHGNMW